MKFDLKLNELLRAYSRKKLLSLLSERDGDERNKDGYEICLDELISFSSCERPSTIYVDYIKCDFSDDWYFKVNILNPDFVRDYPKGIAWGGREDEEFDCPHGKFNVNWKGYQKLYAISGTERANFAFSEIEISEAAWLKSSNVGFLLAEIIWELTFNGFTEKESEEFWERIIGMKDEL